MQLFDNPTTQPNFPGLCQSKPFRGGDNSARNYNSAANTEPADRIPPRKVSQSPGKHKYRLHQESVEFLKITITV